MNFPKASNQVGAFACHATHCSIYCNGLCTILFAFIALVSKIYFGIYVSSNKDALKHKQWSEGLKLDNGSGLFSEDACIMPLQGRSLCWKIFFNNYNHGLICWQLWVRICNLLLMVIGSLSLGGGSSEFCRQNITLSFLFCSNTSRLSSYERYDAVRCDKIRY